MPLPKSAASALRHHKPIDRAVVTLTGPDGRRRDSYLGEWNRAASRVEYARLLTGYDPATPLASAGVPTRAGVPADLTVSELLTLFLAHAKERYRHPDGRPATEFANYQVLLRFVRKRCGAEVAREFGPLRLTRLWDVRVKAGWCRRNVNAQVNRVRRIVKWAASEGLVPARVFDALRTVAGRRAGRSAAPEKASMRAGSGGATSTRPPRCGCTAPPITSSATGARPG